MTQEHSVAIIGLGLIGGSLGLAIGTLDPRESPIGRPKVIGYDQDKKTVRNARGRLAIDIEADSAAAAVRDASVVIIATPVRAVRDVMLEIAPYLRHGTLVLDTASTKEQVLQWAREILPTTVSFIGGHPMAGSERGGIEAATMDLLRGSIFCLCPDQRAKGEAIDLAQALVEAIGAKSYFIDPVEHDAYVAGISHLPFVLSAALVEVTSRSPGWVEMQPIAATGFRDVSRLASGDPAMHRDICLTNGPAVTRWINDTIRLLVEMREAIAADNAKALDELFTHAKDARQRWLEQAPNVRPGERQEAVEKDDMHGPMLSIFSGGFSPRRKNRGNDKNKR